MPNLRKIRGALLAAYDLGAIDDVEFALLYDLSTSKNLEIPYWQYEQFNLENMNADECKAEFRFEKENLHDLVDALQLEDEQLLYNRLYSRSSLCSFKTFCISMSIFRYGAKIC